MNPYTRFAVTLVTVALACYTIGTVGQQRGRRVTLAVLAFLTAGVTFDVVATLFMILGSGKALSLHGLLGYSALAAMVIEVAMAWRWRIARGGEPIAARMALYGRLAYGYWVIAFVSGGLLVALAHRAVPA
jgi:hypothetical protein